MSFTLEYGEDHRGVLPESRGPFVKCGPYKVWGHTYEEALARLRLIVPAAGLPDEREAR